MSKKASDGENHCTALPHHIAKAKLSVCCLQEVHCQWLLPANKTVLSKSTNSTGLAMQHKGNTELVLELK